MRKFSEVSKLTQEEFMEEGKKIFETLYEEIISEESRVHNSHQRPNHPNDTSIDEVIERQKKEFEG